MYDGRCVMYDVGGAGKYEVRSTKYEGGAENGRGEFQMYRNGENGYMLDVRSTMYDV
jgi:hypothetical protein